MRALCLLVILTSSFFSNAQDKALVESARCYELSVLSWHPASSKKTDFLPRRFMLTTRSAYSTPGEKKRFVAQNLDSKVRWDLDMSSWTVEDSNTLEITWTTGYVGYRVSLTRLKDEFQGVAHSFTDTDRKSADSLDVVVREAECKAPGAPR